MNDFIEICASLAECCIFVRLCNGYLGFKNEKMKWLKTLSVYLPLALVDVFLTQVKGLENISALVLLSLMFVYSLVFLQGKIWEKILVPIIPTATALPINMMVIGVFSAIADNNRAVILQGGAMRIPTLFFSKALFFFACEIVIRIRKKQASSLTGFQWVIQLSCFFISFLISTLLWNISRGQAETSPYFLMIFLLIAALNILLYILMNKMQRDNVTKEEYALVKANLEAQQNFAVETRERYSEMKTLRHDVKHYLSTAAELISDGQHEKAKSYIENVINEKINSAVIGVNTGSAVIDAVINRRLAICAEKKIEVKCLIDMQFVSENDIDVSILLSNLLDNAIMGCTNSEDPEIELFIGKKKSFTYITVKNSIFGSVLKNNPDLKTSKPDKTVHGFGIKSINNIAKKYDGSADFKEESGKFLVEIWVNLEK